MEIFLIFMFFFFKQKTAYEMRISDWSSDVCSSDLLLSREYGLVSTGIADAVSFGHVAPVPENLLLTSCGELCPIIPDNRTNSGHGKIGRASCRESVCLYV